MNETRTMKPTMQMRAMHAGWLATIVVASGLLSPGVHAESKHVTGNHSIVQMLTRTVGTVDLQPGHEFALQSRVD